MQEVSRLRTRNPSEVGRRFLPHNSRIAILHGHLCHVSENYFSFRLFSLLQSRSKTALDKNLHRLVPAPANAIFGLLNKNPVGRELGSNGIRTGIIAGCACRRHFGNLLVHLFVR